ncbi:MAG: prephenate dehydrogenase/arogenate dehydrogenase family protein [Hydrococcus sp. Prado102]|jgi:prephenate dehydrogenase/chorismate mutase/prephenate dehydrogenase|nr:prephenate dehydrogenase/arogenate dehydrogenase family protein [Hydrococcus sp. Prado102]
MLQPIDRELIELLGKKISLLRESNCQNLIEQSEAEFLSKFGVPEFVWKNLTLSCAAASAIAHPPLTKPRHVTIIGGRGKMGHFFVEQLSTAGHQVSILEQDDWQDAPKLLGKADLVLVCVPIEHMANAIAKASPYLSPSTVLAEISSIKTNIVSVMLESHSGAVLSLHPMFGPSVDSFLAQNIIVCPGRNLEASQWFLDLIESRGGKLTFCTPQEHDKMMVNVQAIRHFITFSLGVFLAEEEINLKRHLEFTTSLYRLQLDMVNRLFACDGSLYLHLMLCDRDRTQAITRLAATYSRLAELIAQQDKDNLKKEFDTTCCFLGSHDCALTESDYIIESLSIFLAARESENSLYTNNKNLAA